MTNYWYFRKQSANLIYYISSQSHVFRCETPSEKESSRFLRPFFDKALQLTITALDIAIFLILNSNRLNNTFYLKLVGIV